MIDVDTDVTPELRIARIEGAIRADWVDRLGNRFAKEFATFAELRDVLRDIERRSTIEN